MAFFFIKRGAVFDGREPVNTKKHKLADNYFLPKIKLMIKYWIKRNWYRYTNRGQHLKLGKHTLLNMKCRFEGWNVIGDHCEISTSTIGLATYICANAVIRHTRIGRFCSIGKNLQTGLGLHPTETFVSTHPSFFSVTKQSGFSFVRENRFRENKFVDEKENCIVQIGHDVWIGNDVTIMDGLSIGDGAIIATGAIVTSNVEPYAIVAGVPARIKKYRFSKTEIEKLLITKWWNWDIETIRLNNAYFSNIKTFIDWVE